MKVRVLSREFYGCTGLVENGEVKVYINGKEYGIPHIPEEVEPLPESFQLQLEAEPIRWIQEGIQ